MTNLQQLQAMSPKEDSPALQAYFQQFGDRTYVGADQFNLLVSSLIELYSATGLGNLQAAVSNGSTAILTSLFQLSNAHAVMEMKMNGDMRFETESKLDLITQYMNFTTSVLQIIGDVRLSNPGTHPTSVVTRQDLDNVQANLRWKVNVRAATTANITLSGLQTVDGVVLVAGDRVLVKNQSNATQNGIYIAGSGTWSRSTDGNTGELLADRTIPVKSGFVNQDTWWTIINDTVTLGTTYIMLTQTGGAGTYAAGLGLLLNGNLFSVDPSYVSTGVMAAIATAIAAAPSGQREPKIVSGTTYTIAEEDKTKLLKFTSASAVTVTVPSGLGANNRYEGVQYGAGKVSFVGGSGVSVRKGASELAETAEQYSAFGLAYTAANDYMLYGKLTLL